MRLLCGLFTLCLATQALADPIADADAHVAAAVALAAEGRNHEAIARFKAAERSFPRAEHDCNIALVYLRLEVWHRAHNFLQRCDARKPTDRPAWIDRRREELEARFAAGGYGRLEVAVQPPVARVVPSAFAPDEPVVNPGAVWLPVGPVLVKVSAPDHRPIERRLNIGTTPAQLVLSLAAEAPVSVKIEQPPTVIKVAAPVVTERPPVPAPPEPRSVVGPWILVGAGVAAAVGGGLTHLSALSDQDEAAGLTKGTDPWQDALDARDRKDVIAVSLYVAGGLAIAGGLTWLLWPETEGVSLAPTPDGFAVGWRASWR